MIEGIQKLDLLLQSVPKKIDVDNISALNVTFVNDPLLTNSSVEFDINGLFISSEKTSARNYFSTRPQISDSCGGAQKMLSISLDEVVFNSASVLYFQVIFT